MHHPVHHVSVKLLLLVVVILTQLDGAVLSTVTESVIGKNVTRGTNENYTKEETSRNIEGRKKEEKDMMTRILPMMVIPFMVSTAMIPMMLVSLKFMLLKSALIGKLAVLLLILNLFRNRSSGQGGVFTHNLNERMSMAHYGYNGEEEYGAYINKRKRNLR
ncbi:unnamed protein product [Tenebrio molitor]|nr:unnamed protein product [Tenebrio molitor]